jgi:abortive infection bacteriophage resistance protein
MRKCCIICFSDRVAETCEACDRGSFCGDSLFILGSEKMSKTFLTYSEQIYKLKNEKNLIIDDESYAVEMLKQVGYFKLIGGYKHLFKNKTTHKYKDNTHFYDIVGLYTFDESLREINMKYILKAEQQLKSLISYYFCDKYGDTNAAYLTKSNYNYTTYRNRQDTDKLVKMLYDNYISRKTDYPYIEHYKIKHGDLPLWVLINALTFGNISKMYRLLPQGLQISISKNYRSLNEKKLGQIITVMTKFRNACAHGERFFTYRTTDSIPDLPIHGKLSIPKKGSQYIYGKNDLFSVMISLYYLLPREIFSEYKKSVNKLIKSYLKNSPINSSEFLSEIGFPQNWSNITRYKS